MTTYLHEIAGPDMYRRNAFHLTGLSTAADGRAVRERRQRLTTIAESGDEEARAALPAFEELRDERHRLVQELFWYWDIPDHTCGCSPAVHAVHDTAVRRHAKALRLETGSAKHEQSDQAWSEAARKWAELLRRAAVWDHVRYRIEQLGDRRMDEHTVDALRDALPRALLAPVIDLAVAAKSPARLIGHVQRWDGDTGLAHDLLADAAAPLLADLRATVEQAAAHLDADRPAQAAKTLHRTAMPQARRLGVLLPHHRHRETARIHDQIAVLLNNSALSLAQSPERASEEYLTKLFTAALALVVTPQQRKIIKENADNQKAARKAALELAPYGGIEGAARRVTEYLQDGRFAEARAILIVLSRHVADPAEATQIDRLLTQIGTVVGQRPGLAPRRPPASPSRPSPVRTSPTPYPTVSWPRAVTSALVLGALVVWLPFAVGRFLGPVGEIVAGVLWVVGVVTTAIRVHNTVVTK